MKVLLAYRAPDEAADDPRAMTLPPGLRLLAARLRSDGHDASVANFSRLAWKQVETFLAESAPVVVGVSCSTFNRHSSVRLARLARRACPGVTVILGGPHAAAMPGLLLGRVREIDAVALGDGEEAIAAACRRLEAAESLDGIPGLVTRTGPALAPIPATREAWPTLAGLEGAGLQPERDLQDVIASRPREGAPWRRSAASLVEELADLRAAFGVIEVSLAGPGLVDAPWLRSLSDALLAGRHPVSFDCPAAIEDLGDPPAARELGEALLAAREAGLRRIRLVLDDDVAAGLPSELLGRTSALLRHAGIASDLTLRIGGLGESLGSKWLDAMRAVIRTLRPAAGRCEPRGLLPATPEWAVASADEGLDDSFWMDEDRAFVPLIAESVLARGAAALDVVFREVAREAAPGPRDLDALEARGESAWTHVDWGDYRMAHGDAPEAERRYRLAHALQPWSPFPWLRLAALFRRGRGDAARESAALKQALALVPRHAAAREQLDEIRQRAERRGRRRGPRPPA